MHVQPVLQRWEITFSSVHELLPDPGRAQQMGKTGRARAVEHFAWPAIAEQAAALYRRLQQQRAAA